MQFSLGISPCPNDTYIFDAWVNRKIDHHDIDVSLHLEDVQTLNEWALHEKLDITKISFGVYPLIKENYVLLDSGSAMGLGVGPLLITTTAIANQINSLEIDSLRIAIPGENTTAHFLFNKAFPNAQRKQFMVFHEIETAILNNTVDAGVIIHENRFTYQEKGLIRLMDLGNFWEKTTGLPIPLGSIVIHKRILAQRDNINQLIHNSLIYARQHDPLLPDFVKKNAQEMSEDVMRQHIDLYVNDYSLSMGEIGHMAVAAMMNS
ncbi:MAG: 1,4-dihydroxy-6-naphthoate synthase [Bacteroidetes bacterium]|nr:1,4-dihydroxy-6-naphthoate synthase [Bacteroidota bacterium]